MIRARWLVVLSTFTLAFTLPGLADAQVQNGNLWPVPRLTALAPNGAKAGTTLEVVFQGTDIINPDALVFSHPGIKGTPIIPPPPMVDPKKPAAKPPAPTPITKFTVSIAADVPPGHYDARVLSKMGISNPRVFVVSNQTEFVEKEPNNDIDVPQKIELDSSVSGVISAANDVDYYTFAGKKGQRVLIVCRAPSLDSKLNPEVRLYRLVDKRSLLVSEARALPFQDGLLDVTLPESDDYFIRLVHFTNTAGGPDYFYRLSVTTGPWIDVVHPAVVEPGKSAQITLYGRNLPGGKVEPTAVLAGRPLEKLTVTVNAPADPTKLEYLERTQPRQGALDGFEYQLKTPVGLSNPKLLTFGQAPVVLEKEGNDSAESAQEVKTPCEIAGLIDKPLDRDWYAFEAKKGDVLMIELFSQRLDYPTDTTLTLKNLATKQEFPIQDDTADTVSAKGFYTASQDPQPFRFVVPTDGKYHLMVTSHYSDFSSYRLRIAPENPDFRLIVMPTEDYRPDTVTVGQGGQQFFIVMPVRRDGFKGPIELKMEGQPAGVIVPSPQILSFPMSFTYFVVQAGDNAPDNFNGPIKVTGTALINGKPVTREARSATITWPTTPQSNVATVTRLDRQAYLAIRNKAPGKLVASPDKHIVQMGEKVTLNLKLTRISPEFKANFTVTSSPGELPQGMQYPAVTFSPGKDEQPVTITTQPTVPLPGTYNLVFRGAGSITPPYENAKAVNTILPSNPVQIIVVPKSIANLSVDNANPTLKLGGEVMITLKAARQFDMTDALNVKLLPDNANGVTAMDATIPAGQNEVKIALKVPATANPGQRNNLTLRATTVLHGLTLTHEVKFNVNVVK
jgi:hypothetical protein